MCEIEVVDAEDVAVDYVGVDGVDGVVAVSVWWQFVMRSALTM